MLLGEIESELGENELGILGKCIDTESTFNTYSLQSFPFCPSLCCIFLCKILSQIIPMGEKHGS